MDKKYTIGLDIGTTSVGWAVIDDDFNLVQGKKKIVEIDADGKVFNKRTSRTNLWGVRLFEAGKTAAERRSKRGARRRLARRRERLRYLQEIFVDEMKNVDPNFFYRLDESFLQFEDKGKNKEKWQIEIVSYPLFRTEKEEKAYYKDFPTIYHLRHHVMTNEVDDVRLIYLAMHHILKFRGHFIQEGIPMEVSKIDIESNVQELFKKLNIYFSELEEETEYRKHPQKYKFDKIDAIEKILKEKKISKSTKSNRISTEVLGFKKDIALFKAIVGNKVNIGEIFDKPEYAEKEMEEMPKEIYFSKKTFDDKYADLENVLTEEELEILRLAKAVYESMVLDDTMNEKASLSLAMIEKYNDHKQDLGSRNPDSEYFGGFKKFIHEKFGDDVYNEMFKFNIENNYQSYVKGFDKGNKLDYSTQENFYKYVETVLETKKDELGSNSEYIDILQKIELETFLPKQRMFKNSAIPYQVHEYELLEIIKRQAKKFPFLTVDSEDELMLYHIDENGKEKPSKEFKIQALMKFKIPYYIGPLIEATSGEKGKKESDKSRFAWMQKKEGQSDEKITPWNFEQVVDEDESAREFIKRMTRFCTYLPEEPVLPQNSLLYQEYTVLNELLICGYYDEQAKKVYFDEKTRKQLINDIWKKRRSVSKKDVQQWLYCHGMVNDKEVRIFGVDREKRNFNTKMTTYFELKEIVGAERLENNIQFFDKIVEFQTVFDDDKMLRRQIEGWYNSEKKVPEKDEIKKLSKKFYTGWGRLSRKLLTSGLDNGKSVMDYMREVSSVPGYVQNFMTIINDDKKQFKSYIEEVQTKDIDTSSLCYDLVDNIAGSPAIKRGIWQSLKVIGELSDILGKENISRVVIEMARENRTSKRTKTRQTRIKELYKKVTSDFSDFILNGDPVGLKDPKKSTAKEFDNEKVFLYYLQNGKDMYTGEDLGLSPDELASYEVDHIIPQTYIKDDSFDNKVLVKRNSNQVKDGDVPSLDVVREMRSYWKLLLDAKLISRKKFSHLTKSEKWNNGKPSEEDLTGFINRQLVETRQITKNVAQILNEYFKDVQAEVLTPKAGLTSQFRSGIIYLHKEELDEDELQTYLKNGGKIVDGKFIEQKLHDGFYKVREINDYHHAHDAYLNAVVANYLYLTFPENKRKILVYGHYDKEVLKQLGKYATTRKHNFRQFLTAMAEDDWVNLETGEIIARRDQALETIDKVMNYKLINIVKKAEEKKGAFADESLYAKSDDRKGRTTKGVIPIKGRLDVDKYGGFDTLNSAYSLAFSYLDKKGNKKISLARVPIIFKNKIEKNPLEYLQEQFGDFQQIEIVKEEIFNNTLVQMGDGKYRLITSYAYTWPVKRYCPSKKEYYLLNHLLTTTQKKDTEVIDLNIKGVEKLKLELTEGELISQIDEFYQNYLAFVQKNQFFSGLGTFDGISPESISNGTAYSKFEVMVLDEKIAELVKTLKRTWTKQEENNPGKKSKNIEKYGTTLTGATLIYQSITGLYETRYKL